MSLLGLVSSSAKRLFGKTCIPSNIDVVLTLHNVAIMFALMLPDKSSNSWTRNPSVNQSKGASRQGPWPSSFGADDLPGGSWGSGFPASGMRGMERFFSPSSSANALHESLSIGDLRYDD